MTVGSGVTTSFVDVGAVSFSGVADATVVSVKVGAESSAFAFGLGLLSSSGPSGPILRETALSLRPALDEGATASARLRAAATSVEDAAGAALPTMYSGRVLFESPPENCARSALFCAACAADG